MMPRPWTPPGGSPESKESPQGFSAGAVLVAAEKLLAGVHARETVAVVLADSGMKYLSTDLWNE